MPFSVITVRTDDDLIVGRTASSTPREAPPPTETRYYRSLDEQSDQQLQDLRNQLIADGRPVRLYWNDTQGEGYVLPDTRIRCEVAIYDGTQNVIVDSMPADGTTPVRMRFVVLDSNDVPDDTFNGAVDFLIFETNEWVRLNFFDGVAIVYYRTSISRIIGLASTDTVDLKEQVQVTAFVPNTSS